MQKVLLFSVLLLLGLLGSQWLPGIVGPDYATIGDVVRVLTMVGLSFMMIRVGYEFDNTYPARIWEPWRVTVTKMGIRQLPLGIR